jgi:protein TonB
MPTDLLPTRAKEMSQEITQEKASHGVALSLAAHLLVVGGIAGAIWAAHALNPHWGEQDPTVGSVQASMVDSLPLPPKQRFKENEVLTSDKPSVAPTPPPPTPAPPVKTAPVKPKAEERIKPDEIPIPVKTPPVKAPLKAEREQPTPVRRPATPPPPTRKATTGDTSGVQIPQSVVQLKNGTASVTVEDRAFGDRYAYYIRTVARLINESKSQDLDGPETKGKETRIHFVIGRDGTPSDFEVEVHSGAPSLDLSTMRAIERIDNFGPLPAGDHLGITYVWDSH